jgi:hypothetical protein
MNIHARTREDLDEVYDRGFDAGLTAGVKIIEAHIEEAYQNGQVVMQKKILMMLQKYYGSSVYDRIKELVTLIDLEE